MIYIAQQPQGCLAACIASLLELPLGLVPDLARYKTAQKQEAALSNWLASHYGCSLLELPLTQAKWTRIPAAGLVTVKYRKRYFHAVVGRVNAHGRLDIIHDPDTTTEAATSGTPVSISYLVPTIERVRLCCAVSS